MRNSNWCLISVHVREGSVLKILHEKMSLEKSRKAIDSSVGIFSPVTWIKKKKLLEIFKTMFPGLHDILFNVGCFYFCKCFENFKSSLAINTCILYNIISYFGYYNVWILRQRYDFIAVWSDKCLVNLWEKFVVVLPT